MTHASGIDLTAESKAAELGTFRRYVPCGYTMNAVGVTLLAERQPSGAVASSLKVQSGPFTLVLRMTPEQAKLLAQAARDLVVWSRG